MLRSLSNLLGYHVHAADGEIGRVNDFYIDTDQWRLRYMIVNAADWLDGRHIYLSSLALDLPDNDQNVWPVKLTKAVIQDSPEIATGKMINRQDEVALHNYFQWPFYWKPSDKGGIGPGNLAAIPLIEMASDIENQLADMGSTSQLRSLKEISGYPLQARDGEIGRLEDFIVNDEDWNILYMLVEVGAWLGSKKVLLSPSWAEKVDWLESEVRMDLSRETIRNSPEYDPHSLQSGTIQ